MPKSSHEIRDAVHGFVTIDSDERLALDSEPVQRLRNIHQLAMAYLLYPGATHKRFTHALGTMELASRVYDVVTRPQNVHPSIRDSVAELNQEDKRRYWRRVLRMAALCHDLGHLPFSHAAEKRTLPEGWNHERLTIEFIRSPFMAQAWNQMRPRLETEDIVKLAVGPKELPDVSFTSWEALLSEIIVGDAFGVDRMDYLLRDSYHAGVAYGRFDHYRLIDSLRILPRATDDSDRPEEPTLGIDEGGIHTAEALLLARYFMYTQVYFHPVRRAYDIHLIEFLQAWLPGGQFPTDASTILRYTDIEVLAALAAAAHGTGDSKSAIAQTITKRRHFKTAYSLNPEDRRLHSSPAEAIRTALERQYGADKVRRDPYTEKGAVFDFRVVNGDNRVVSSRELSDVLNHIPIVAVDYIFVAPEIRDEARRWLDRNRTTILTSTPEEKE